MDTLVPVSQGNNQCLLAKWLIEEGQVHVEICPPSENHRLAPLLLTFSCTGKGDLAHENIIKFIIVSELCK